MSIFTNKVTKTTELPTDPGQSVTIRKLAPRHLEKAQRESQLKSLEMLRSMGGPAFLEELQRATKAKNLEEAVDKVKEAGRADPMFLYDRDVLLTSGVVAWTYPEPFKPDLLLELDDETADFIAREVLRLALPKLFQSEEQQEAERKNG